MLCVVGDLLTDVIVQLDREPARGSDTPAAIAHTRGGSAANVAVAAVRAGVAARFAGQVGDDDRGRALVHELERAGVDVRAHYGGTTGTVVALVDGGGERSFLTQRAAAVDYTLNSAAQRTEVLDGADWLHVPGYSFADGSLADTSHSLVGLAAERAILRSISTGSESMLREFGRDSFLELIRTIEPTAVVANAPEARQLLGRELRFPATTWSVITRGDGPTSLTHSGGESRSIPPQEADVVDSTGAGDSFTGALCAALMRGESPLRAVRAGHVMAARTLGRPGATIEEASP